MVKLLCTSDYTARGILKKTLPDTAHVEVGNLHNLGEAIDPGGVCRVQLLLGNSTQGTHKLHNGLTVQLVTAAPRTLSQQPL